jgi:hypothetical protein
VVALGAIAVVTPDRVHAQPRVFITPTLTTSAEYDDNVDSRANNAEGDALMVARPGFRLEFIDEPFTLAVGASTRAEKYFDRTDLDNIGDQWDANLSLQVQPTPNLLTSLTVAAIRSVDSTFADTFTGITQGRFSSLSVAVSGAASYQIDPLTSVSGNAAYRLLTSDSPDSRDSQTREAGAAFSRQLNPRNSGVLRYAFTQFKFDDPNSTQSLTALEAGRTQTSHSVQLGVVHIWSPTLTISWANGVTFLEEQDGNQRATWNSSQRYDQQFRNFTLSAAYDRNAGVAGITGGAGVTQTLSITGTWSATRELTLSADARVSDSETRGDVSDTRLRTYSGTLRAVYRLLEWLSLEASFRHQTQDDRSGPNDVKRNVFSIGLTASDRFRLY